jgi:hypothetical protein
MGAYVAALPQNRNPIACEGVKFCRMGVFLRAFMLKLSVWMVIHCFKTTCSKGD